jgi:hypothetical protein
MLLRQQITDVTGTDPLSREGLAGWTAVVMDVYTGGVFAPPPDPGKPSGEPAAVEEPPQ